MKLMPASRPAWRAAIDVASSLPPQRHPPRAHAPKATAEAWMPLLPRGRFFMAADHTNLPLHTQRRPASPEHGGAAMMEFIAGLLLALAPGEDHPEVDLATALARRGWVDLADELCSRLGKLPGAS